MVKHYQPCQLAGAEGQFLFFFCCPSDSFEYIFRQTPILVYATIPAKSRLSLDVLLSPACLAHYSVREVILRRFIPARMRD